MLMLRVARLAGVMLLAAVSLPAQAAEKQAFAGNPLKLSAATAVDASCGGAVNQSLLQEQLETGLRRHGIALSSVHTARLGMEVECMSSPESGNALAIHQCLDLKELVSQNSAEGRAAMASTWRKCAAFQCRSGACAKTADGRLASLLDGFSEELQSRAGSAALTAPIITIRNAVGTPAAALAQAAAPDGAGTRTVFFSVYILFCLSVLLKWQLRGQYR